MIPWADAQEYELETTLEAYLFLLATTPLCPNVHLQFGNTSKITAL